MPKVIGKHTPNQVPLGRVGVLVLGMHRSGTSALTRVLSLLGCDLPKTLMSVHPSNETGHWESSAIMSLDDEILNSAGSNWQDWQAFNPGWYNSPKVAEFKGRALSVLEEEFGDSRLFILKDPRICRFAPFWLDVLATANIRPAIILPLRNPLEVAASLAKRDDLDPSFDQLLWLRHVLEAEAGTRGLTRFYCSYDGLMTGWSRLAARAQEALGISWPRLSGLVGEEIDAFLSERLRHHQETPKRVVEDPALSAWLRDAFEIFNRWAEDGESAADFPVLDRMRAEFDVAAPAFARLISSGLRAQQKARVLEHGLSEAQGRLDAAESAFATQEERAHLLESEIGAVRQRLADMETKAVELSAEREALGRAVETAEQALSAIQEKLSSTEAALEHRNGEVERNADRLAQVQAELAQRDAEGRVARQELAEVKGQLSQTQSALAQRQAEADETAGLLAESRQLLAEMESSWKEQAERASLVETELGVERKRLTERFGEIAALTQALREKETEIGEGRLTLARTEAEMNAALQQSRLEKEAVETRLAERFGEIAALTQALREKETEIGEARLVLARTGVEMNAALQEARLEKAAVEVGLAERFGEIATLSRMLQEKEALAKRSDVQAEWLRDAAAILLNVSVAGKGWWFALLPASFQRKLQMKELERRGLFDGEAYLAAYPDVANEGMDPLRHYIKHGMKEGRRLG